MGRHASISYQPALDGVRALAVLAVLAFHAQLPGMSGGYLGVSVFFTLSGFLITSLLVAERDGTGRVDVGAFYARRVRRLVPASVLCIAVVVVLAATTTLFEGVADLRRHAVGSLLQVANWMFLAGGGSYQELFERSAGAVSPLEHYWSLAIEEQFYWLWPLAFVLMVRLAPGRPAQVRLMAVATVAAAVAAPLIAVRWGPDAAYWATPARAAEILVGALLALVLAGKTPSPRVSLLAPVALAGLVVACVTFPAAGGPAYAGALPLVAVVSGGLLLGLQADGPVRSALSVRPLVWLGGISYGVYLYHWPLFVLLDERRTGLDGVTLFALRLAVTLVLAQVSYVAFEHPIRVGTRLRPRVTVSLATGATVAVAAVAMVSVPTSDGPYWRGDSDVVAAAAIVASDEALAVLQPLGTAGEEAGPPLPPDGSPSSSPSTAAPVGTAPDASTTVAPDAAPLVLSRPVRIVVAGDSTAEATGAGLVAWAAANPERSQAVVDAQPGCGFVRDGEVLVQEWRPVPSRCDDWLDDTLPAAMAELRPDVVLLMTTSWDVLDHRWAPDEVFVPTHPEFRRRIEADLAATTARLLDAGAASVAWVLQPVPNVFWWSSGQAQEDPSRHQVLHEVMRQIAADDPGRVAVIDMAGWLVERGLDTDRELRPDGVHWSTDGSTLIATDFLGEALVRVAVASGSHPSDAPTPEEQP
jgi:peptidoglycan/LPS O-acetylase OafA/YrhL